MTPQEYDQRSQQRLDAIELAMKNDLARVTWDADDGLFGFVIRWQGVPFATVYADQHGTYTVYQAINDIDRGVSVADEKLVQERCTIGNAISAIRRLQLRIERGEPTGPADKPVADYHGRLETWEGKRLQMVTSQNR